MELFDSFTHNLELIFGTRLLEKSFLGNSFEEYIVAILAFIIFLIVFKLFQVIIIARLKKLARKTATDIDDTLIKIVNSLRPPFYLYLSFYFAVQFLSFVDVVEKTFAVILIVWVVYQVIAAAQVLIDYIVRRKMGDDAQGHAEAAIQFLSLISKIILWSLGLLFVLSNLGVDITSLIAALGVGGIAVAFALQKILSDLFSSFAIYFDKPFVPGDFIIVDGKAGTIEKIGIKTTRIRALQGEELVYSNDALTSAVIQNFHQMEKRRVVLSLGATYGTSTEKMKKVKKIIEDIIETVEEATFDRAHFKSFADSALIIEVVYYTETGDYATYMDVNEEIHLKIKEAFEKEKIDFAFPTQTIHLEK